jgi:CspA family cold shock protein
MSERTRGTVKWFNSKKGFGFIKTESTDDIFIHYSGIKGEGYRTIEEGQEVEFTIKQGKKGPEASDLIVVQ